MIVKRLADCLYFIYWLTIADDLYFKKGFDRHGGNESLSKNQVNIFIKTAIDILDISIIHLYINLNNLQIIWMVEEQVYNSTELNSVVETNKND